RCGMEQLVKVTRGGQVTIPADLRRQAGIEIGDYVEMRMVEGRLVLVPKQLIDKDQTWFWTEEWQAVEREAEDDLRAGRLKAFDTLDELIADLDSDEAEG
ncbi:MAG: AbrB/MazE/SpoVT family DNA-binding domain-containing protein, partial [Anaerolineae bacterium]|nr:AbrB/MazE/SpoVT family DNA-binding domain-containing protein [Anaerolineae bacterium]